LLAANTAPSGSVPRDSSLPYRTESQMLVTWFGDRSQNDLFPFGRVLKKQGLLRTFHTDLDAMVATNARNALRISRSPAPNHDSDIGHEEDRKYYYNPSDHFNCVDFFSPRQPRPP